MKPKCHQQQNQEWSYTSDNQNCTAILSEAGSSRSGPLSGNGFLRRLGGSLTMIGLLLFGIARTTTAQEQNGALGELKNFKAVYNTMPWDGGPEDAAAMLVSNGSSVPAFVYRFPSTKEGPASTRQIMMVGGNPFVNPLSSTTISTVLVPLRVITPYRPGHYMGFDPTVLDNSNGDGISRYCGTGRSPVDRFMASPLASDVPNLTIDGVNVGTTQWINGFRRAEFWKLIGSGGSAYQNTLNVTKAPMQTISTGDHGYGLIGLCFDGQGGVRNDPLFGLVAQKWLDNYLRTTVIPDLQSKGIINPNQFVIFLMRDVLQSTTDPPNDCCILGYHGATGSQTYAVVQWDTWGKIYDDNYNAPDSAVASHEIGEWMDDPFVQNSTPGWGNIGQELGICISPNYLEVGDPLSGTLMPTIALNGFPYHVQELAFTSWFFNSRYDSSLGAGGKFSSNGTFRGPSKTCQSGGGTY